MYFFYQVLGPNLILFLKNDEGNVRKLRKVGRTLHLHTHSPTHPLTHPPTHSLTHSLTHSPSHPPTEPPTPSLLKVWAKQIDESLGQAEPHNRCASLRGLLQTESASGIHKAGGVLADPSAAIALLWMRRSLQFLVHLLHELCEPGTSVAAAMRAAYDAHLEPYHGWVLKQARTCTCTCTMHDAHAHAHAHARAHAQCKCTHGGLLEQASQAADCVLTMRLPHPMSRPTRSLSTVCPSVRRPCTSSSRACSPRSGMRSSRSTRNPTPNPAPSPSPNPNSTPNSTPNPNPKPNPDQVFALEARECVVVLSRVVDAMRTLFEELDLEDVRKAPWI